MNSGTTSEWADVSTTCRETALLAGKFVWIACRSAGIGLAVDDPRAEDPAQWKRLNLLGFALMDARDAVRQ